MKTLSKEDLRSIVRGACFMASGGGGGYDVGMQFVDNYQGEKKINVISIEELKNSTKCGAVVAYLGSPIKMKSVKHVDAVVDAVNKLYELRKGEKGKVDYVIPVEIGAISSVIACLVAAELDVPVVDVDGAGRAVPTLDLLTYAAGKVSVNPTVLSSEKDKGIHHQVYLNISDDTTEGGASKMESLARPILNMPEYDQKSGMAIWFFEDITQLKKSGICIPDTLSLCKGLGELITQEQEKPIPSTDRIKEYFKEKNPGRIVKEVCSGILKDVTTKTSGGFDVGVITIEDKEGKGRIYKILFQNESLIVWDSKSLMPLTMAPDLINFLITTKDGKKHQWVYANDDMVADNKLKTTLQDASIRVMAVQAPKELVASEKRVRTLRDKFFRKYKKIRNEQESTLPKHYLSMLNNLGYYGEYIPLKK